MSKDLKKLIITIRHGERSDFSGLKPKFGTYDPELTKHGEDQGASAGKLISKKLEEMGYPKEAKIQIFTSPFTRTIQTSRGILKGLKSENAFTISDTIKVDPNLCELINYEWNGHIPKNELNIMKSTKIFQDEFKDDKIEVIDTYDVMPGSEEDDDMCHDRLKKFMKRRIPELVKEGDTVSILVTHASPCSELNKVLGYPGPHGWSYIKYCYNFFFEINEEDNSTKYIDSIKTPQ